MNVENTSMIYYRDEKGIVQDGNEWIHDLRHGDIKSLEGLVEVYWSANDQAWLIN